VQATSPSLPGVPSSLAGYESPVTTANDPSRLPVDTSPDIRNASTAELLRNNIAALRIPADSLSTALLAFCRFFSLAPDTVLLGNIRREILGSGKSSAAGTVERAQEEAGVQAKAFASLAVFDKGVLLHPKAFTRYASLFEMTDSFIDPVDHIDTDPDEGQTMSSNTNTGSEGSAEDKGSSSEKSSERDDPPLADEIQAMAEQETSKDALLDLLNKLPGTNGQRWVVYSFKTTINGIELSVICRLLKGRASAFGAQEKAIIDITAPKRLYRCFLNADTQDTADKSLCADIRLYPALPKEELASMSKQLSRFLDTTAGLTGSYRGFKEVKLHNGDDSPSWVDDLLAVWFPVDETV